jgi:hypothetical protein
MHRDARAARNEAWRKRYLRMAKKAIELAELNKLDFDLEWLKSLTGVVAWVEREGHITDPQIRGIVNATRAVKNIVRYRKLKEKKHGKAEAEGPARGGAVGDPA